MRADLGSAVATGKKLVRKATSRKWVLSAVAIFFILQLYFVRELLAAELLFGFAFGVVFLIVAAFYIVGTIGERSLRLSEASIRALAQSTRRGYSGLEELSKRPFRRPHSESAQ